MIKHKFLSIIMIYLFCLAVLPAHADGVQDFSIQTDNTIQKKTKVYPNPIDRGSLLTIEIPGDGIETTLLMYNTVGKLIWTHKTFNKKVDFQAPDVSGIYLLRFVENQKVIAVEKIVVKE